MSNQSDFHRSLRHQIGRILSIALAVLLLSAAIQSPPPARAGETTADGLGKGWFVASLRGQSAPEGLTSADWAQIQSQLAPEAVAAFNQQAKLIASDPAADDQFGFSVAVSGDTAVVGSVLDDNAGGVNSGSAYVFVRSGGASWSQQAKLTASDATGGEFFGASVAINGDTAVVGAYRDSDSGSFSGSAYVFVRTGTSWSQQAKLTASDDAANDQFGTSVAVSGDTAVVGAEFDDDGGSSSGSAYVFTRSGTSWSEQAKLIASDDEAGDRFGRSVAVSGDTAVVGSILDDDGGADSGSAYVFTRSGTSWSEQAKLIASDDAAGDQFGISVALSGDTAVIGALLDDDGGSNSGSAYIFTRSGGIWSQQAKLIASDDEAGDNFGIWVAISGDTAVIGANRNDDGGADSGSAYVFTRSGGIWSQQAKLIASDDDAGDNFGRSVAVSGDTVVVGADFDDEGGLNNGAAYIFRGCIPSAQTGAWEDTATWVGALAPTSTDGVCIESGHTVTLNGNAAVDQLWVYQGGTLDLGTNTLTVEKKCQQ